MDEARDCRFPIRCPSCGEETGHPIDVAKEEMHLKVSVYCATCAHLWTQVFNRPPVILKPKPDRRGAG